MKVVSKKKLDHMTSFGERKKGSVRKAAKKTSIGGHSVLNIPTSYPECKSCELIIFGSFVDHKYRTHHTIFF